MHRHRERERERERGRERGREREREREREYKYRQTRAGRLFVASRSLGVNWATETRHLRSAKPLSPVCRSAVLPREMNYIIAPFIYDII